jgi:hypothetical protein
VVVDFIKEVMTTFTTEDEIVRNKCPCDDCQHFQKCKEEEIACRPFAKFVLDNWYYKETPKDPCYGIFNKIFNQKDDLALKNYIRNHKEEDFENTVKSNEGK